MPRGPRAVTARPAEAFALHPAAEPIVRRADVGEHQVADHQTNSTGGLVVTVDLARHMDALRIAVGKVEALASVAAESYDDEIWNNTDPLC